MQTMYPTQTGSPELTLATSITSTATVILLNEDVTLLPAPPNIVTIYTSDNFETILYESIDTVNNELETVTRAFEGTAQAWSAGDSVARLLTAYDIDTFKSNITENQNTIRTDEEIQDVVNLLLTAGANISTTYDDTANTLTITATDTNTQLTDEQVQDIVGAFVIGGTNVTATYDDVANTLTLSATDTQLTTTEVQTAINNDADHGSTAPHNYNTLSTGDVTSANWGDYEIQKDGTDGTGIINFKTV